MTIHVRVPKNWYPRQRPVRAVRRFYRLLDSGVIRARDGQYAGQIAINTVAEEFRVSAQTVWRWIREGMDPMQEMRHSA